MKRLAHSTFVAVSVATSACFSDRPTELQAPQPGVHLNITDASHSGGVGGFYWLTPTVKNGEKTFSGTFDPELQPTITICRITSDVAAGPAACVGPQLRTLSAATPPEIIRVDLSDENYSVNWKSTQGTGIAAGLTYRAILRVGVRVLGWVDLVAVTKQNEVDDLPAAFRGFVVGSPFLFKWRIETGIPGAVVVAPATATIKDNETQSFIATVTDLHGIALAGTAVNWTVDNNAIATLSPTSGNTNGAGQTGTVASPAGTLGTTTVRATASGAEGTASLTIEASCSLSGPDADGDRLPDCYETNTKVFIGVTDTGTDPNDPDTDDDNINDGDEVLGTTLGLDLPAMGVNPLRRDILLEYDWFDDALDGCGSHTHRPTAAMLARVTAAFANGPVSNPDGSTGINFIHDYGQGGAFTGGNFIADADGVIAGGVGNTDFTAYKAANFAANRNGYFHYTLMPHRYATNSSSSGQAEITGDDLIVSLQCFISDVNVANTIVHELGHNLGLRHGGFEDLNYKPNYNSVMNYLYQFPGIDNDCTPPGNGVLSYSVGTRITLDENNLDERQGVCGNPPGPGWDWNGNGNALDFGFALNLNPSNDTVLGVLRDYNDWANLNLSGIGDASGVGIRSLRAPEIVSCTNMPPGAK